MADFLTDRNEFINYKKNSTNSFLFLTFRYKVKQKLIASESHHIG